jgi:hypothetical protein
MSVMAVLMLRRSLRRMRRTTGRNPRTLASKSDAQAMENWVTHIAPRLLRTDHCN